MNNMAGSIRLGIGREYSGFGSTASAAGTPLSLPGLFADGIRTEEK